MEEVPLLTPKPARPAHRLGPLAVFALFAGIVLILDFLFQVLHRL